MPPERSLDPPPALIAIGVRRSLSQRLRDDLAEAGFAVQPIDRARYLLREVGACGPDAVVMDWNDSTTDRLHLWQLAQGHGVPVVVMTSAHDPRQVATILDGGAVDVCSQGVSGAVLGARLRAVLRRCAHVTPTPPPALTDAAGPGAAGSPGVRLCPGSTVHDPHPLEAGARVCPSCGWLAPVAPRD